MLLLLLACTRPLPGERITYTQDREPCDDRVPTRKPLYGDLHVHGAFSFDARNYGATATPEQVLAFAKGEPIQVGGLDSPRTAQLTRPLDFVSYTEHGDLLGEVAHCTTPGSPGYDSLLCEAYQGGDGNGAFDFGVQLAADTPRRSEELCGADGTGCDAAARERWATMNAATDAANDTTSRCGFTAFHGYEYTNTRGVSNLHRNVVFRNSEVPDRPIGVFEAPDPVDLWTQLAERCIDADGACDVVSLPHNSNLSNGHLFSIDAYPSSEVERILALRARLEPVVEIFQHKGDSECRTAFSPDDPHCDFEKLRPEGDPICLSPGTGGMRLWGCSHRLDFVRQVFQEGLAIEAEHGINPYRLGVIGSTDTHNGTPGLVHPTDFPGHVGSVDATAEDRLGAGTVTHDAFINNPGGLAAVWAVENSRDAIFEAIQRRETFATSGPRMSIRLFAADVDASICDDDDRYEKLYRKGVPMGAAWGGPRTFVVEAFADPARDGEDVGLATLQLVKGWLDADGTLHETVIDVATGDAGSLDPATCDASGGVERLCAVYEDPDSSDQPAFYYARALEVPTCRWSTRECATTEPRPVRCDEPEHQTTVQQRVWSSPIFTEAD